MTAPYRVALVGAGRLAQIHARHWEAVPNAEVVAIMDTARDASAKFPGIPGYSDFDELVAREAPDIVDICTPTLTHREYVELSAHAGKAVFVGEPLARTMDDCRAIALVIAETKVTCIAGQLSRYAPAYREAKRAIESGAVGAPSAIRTERLAGFPKPAEGLDWRSEFDLSGGVVLDSMVQDFDWLLWCFGDVSRVYAKGFADHRERPGDMDYALVTLRFTSGAIAHVTGSWAHAGGLRTSFEVAGDGGMIEFDSSKTGVLTRSRTRPPGNYSPESPLSACDEPHYLEFKTFLDKLAGDTPYTNVDDASRAVQISLAAMESIQSGAPVMIS